ncbi:hypothetical protein Cgig2_005645 [Carnegiea gigantea]|uniref:Cytochrome P450 n=1 Tax=Carnegiea gigantea TaxID=171969 RepID=A0A9Q1QNU3_9CARY|nr:hypothetical protein Cgig2_005645 [Carnegiea gigantea]
MGGAGNSDDTNKTAPIAIYLLLIILLPLFGLLFGAQPKSAPRLGNLHMLGRLPHRALTKLAQKYGPIMPLRLGHVPTIVVSSPRAAELFLKQYDAVFASPPIFQASRYMSYGAKGIGFTPYGDFWRRARRMCTLHLLTPAKGLRTAEIEVAVRRLVEASVAREVVDVGERVGELVEGIVFKMLVGKRMEEDKRYDWKGIVREGVALAGAFNFADFVPYLAPLDLQGLTRKMKAVSKVADEMVENIIEDYLKGEDFGQQRDIVGTMLAMMVNPNSEFFSTFDRENVKAIMLDLFVAGIDTSLQTNGHSRR